MNTLKIIASGLLLATSLYSCGCQREKDPGTDLDAVKWETIDLSESYTDPGVAEALSEKGLGSSFRADLHLTFPVTEVQGEGAGSFADSVSVLLQRRLFPEDTLILSSPKEAMESFIDQRLEEFKADFGAAKGEGYSGELLAGFVNTIEMSDSIYYKEHNLFSILTTTEEYTGGAHGLQTSEALTVDFSKQSLLTPELLFKEDSMGEIENLIFKELLKQNNASTGEDLEELGYFNFEEAKVTDNMLLTKEGIAFIYNPYEIAAYFVGTVRITLPYSELSPFLSEEYSYLSK